MNICFLLTSYFPYKNSETFLEHEIGFLCERFDKVVIFSLYGKKNMKTRGLPSCCSSYGLGFNQTPIRHVTNSIKGFFVRDTVFKNNERGMKRVLTSFAIGRAKSIAKRINKIISRTNIIGQNDKIIVYSYWLTDLAVSACLVKKEITKHCKHALAISRCHGYDLYEDRNKYGFLPFRKELIENLDLVFPCSVDGANYLKERFTGFDKKILVSRLGTVDYGYRIKPAFNQKKLFVTCSNIIPIKRVDLFANALSILHHNGISFTWCCFGDGQDLEKIKQIAVNNSYSSKCVFYGRISNKDVIDFYEHNTVDLFFNTSSGEGVPVAIMEALSFGIPCFATDVGGTKEILEFDCGKILSPNITAEELAKQIMDFLTITDSKRFEFLRKNARRNWEKYSNASTNYNEWLDFLLKQLTFF